MKKNICIASRLENISIVEKLVDEISERYHIDSLLYGNMLISLVEAVSNAVKHGNKLDERKQVRITCEVTEKHIVCTISDEGEGFDPSLVPDPTSEDNIDKPHGRGIFLMEKLTDEVQFLNKGATVRFVFELNKKQEITAD